MVLSEDEFRKHMKDLAEYLRVQLGTDWEGHAHFWDYPDSGATIYVRKPKWHLRNHRGYEVPDEYVAFSFYWSNDIEDNDPDGDDPYVALYVPVSREFPKQEQRDELISLVQKPLTDLGFSYDETETGEPLWNFVPLETKTNVPKRSAIMKMFRDLLRVEKQIDGFFSRWPEPSPLPWERDAIFVTVVDAEWPQNKRAPRMSGFAARMLIYDPLKDQVTGGRGPYVMNGTFEQDKARPLLDTADWIVAHNNGGDRGVLKREGLEIPAKKWLDSCHGIDWKGLTGVENKGLLDLLQHLKIDYEQAHEANDDVESLIRVLLTKHQGRTFLARLLDGRGPGSE
jgi:hypothetical protein